MKPVWTRDDVGCYIDNAHGMAHARGRLIELMLEVEESERTAELVKALEGDMSDDDWESDEALDLINEYCAPDVSFMWVDGDLLLRGIEDEPEYESDEATAFCPGCHEVHEPPMCGMEPGSWPDSWSLWVWWP